MRRSRVAAVCMLVAIAGLCADLCAGDTENDKHPVIAVKNTEGRVLATMKHRGPFTDIPEVMAKLDAEVKKGNHLAAGPVMMTYFNSPQDVPAEELLWEAWIPVVRPGKGGGTEFDKLTFKVLGSMFVAYAYHIGPYDKIGETYESLFEWIEKNNYPMAGYPIEVYWSDPKGTPEEKLVTEIWLPVKQRKTPSAVK